MSVREIKLRLHQLIEDTDDEKVLQNLYHQFAENKTNDDWWDGLSQSQKLSLSESEEQYKTGKVVSNEDVLKKIQQWLQK